MSAVTDRFYATQGAAYARFGPPGRETCREDLTFHLQFLRSVLEFGVLDPLVEYLRWLDSVLAARGVPVEHLALSLEWLADFIAGRMEAEDGLVVAAAVRAARLEFERTEPAAIARELGLPEPWPEASAFHGALLAGQRHEASDIVNRCVVRGDALVDVEQHVIWPALIRIGEQWQANQITVAQEHLATAIVEWVITLGLLCAPPPSTTIGKKVLLACVEGNNHVIGLRMASDAFQLAGWDVQYLGMNVPTRALIRHVADWKPDLVGLSISFPHQLRAVRNVIAQLGEQLGGERPAVMVGGLAINRFGLLADMVGADAGVANAQAAVAWANRLTPNPDSSTK